MTRLVTRLTPMAAAFALLICPVGAFAQQHDQGEAHDHGHGEAHDHSDGADHDHGEAQAHAEGEGHEPGAHHEVHIEEVWAPIEFWGAIVNFTLLIVVFVMLGRKPVATYLSSRKQNIEEGLAEAQRMKAQAEAKYEEYSGRLEQLDSEIEEIRAEMVKAGEAERDRIVAEAEAKSARVRRETDFLIEQQIKQLKVDLTQEAVEAAVTAAEQVLRETTNPADQQRLAQTYLERIKTKASEQSGGQA